MTEYLARAAYHELLDLMRDVDATFVEGDRAVTDEVERGRGLSLPHRRAPCRAGDLSPFRRRRARRSCPSSGPTFKWGGDNSDAFYNFAPVAPDLEYRVHGKRGDAVYLSVCVYGGPDDGRWSTRIVSNLNDRDIDFDADGSFEIAVSRERPAGGAQLARARRRRQRDGHARLPRRSRCTARRPSTTSKRSRRSAPPPPLSDADVAGRLRSVTNFLRELLAITPLPDPATPNTIADVWAVPEATYGWAAKDAHYAMGSFELADDERLVITGRSPECAYWGVHALEPVHADVRLPLRARRHQRRASRVRTRRIVEARDRGPRSRPSELDLHRRTPQGRHLLPLVPRGGDAGHADRERRAVA